MKTVLKKCLFLFMVLCVFTITGCSKDTDIKKPKPEAKAEAVQKLPKLLDFGAHKCIACQKMTLILDELTKEYRGVLDVEFIDVWQPENKERAAMYEIETIPTQIFFDAKGEELWRHVGFISKEDILAKWQELGCDLKKPVVDGSRKKSVSPQ